MPMDEKRPLVPSQKDFSFSTGRKKREMNYVCCEINPVRLTFLQLKLASQQSRLSLSVGAIHNLPVLEMLTWFSVSANGFTK